MLDQTLQVRPLTVVVTLPVYAVPSEGWQSESAKLSVGVTQSGTSQ